MSLNVKQTAPAGLVIFDDADQVAEIRNLKLTSARFRAGGDALICETYPLFLFWMQYSNHEDPERNCGSAGKVEVISQTPDQVVLRFEGTTASGECASTMVLTIQRHENPTRYTYRVEASFYVRSEQGWLVTPNPTQGELEFANLWPDGTFSPNPKDQKLFQACYHITSSDVGRIPHHHVETSDKHNIVMNSGDKFLWMPDEENPCLTLVTTETVTAGLCAYMWDAHFAYKICTEGRDVLLPVGAHFEAIYELSSIDEKEAEAIIDKAVDRPAPELAKIPLYVPGVNHFTRTLQNIGRDWKYVWPWEIEGDAVSTPVFDLSYGFDDTSCLRIDSTGNGKSCWKVTTLGPAFGGKPFVDGAQYQVSAIMKTMNLDGKALIALRLHKSGKGSEFDLSNYETFTSGLTLQGNADWRLVKVITHPITPIPDRVHILLIQEGCGTTWFDDVFYEVLL